MMLRQAVFIILAADCLWASDDIGKKSDEKLQEALSNSEKETQLAEKEMKAQEVESKAIVEEKHAKVQEAKDDLQIKKAEMSDEPSMIAAAAAADKEKAKEIEKKDEAVISQEMKEVEEVKKEMNEMEKKDMEEEREEGKDNKGESLVVVKKGTLSWGGAVALCLSVGCVITMCANLARRKQLMESTGDVSHHPMMLGYNSEEDGFRLQSVKQFDIPQQYQVMP